MLVAARVAGESRGHEERAVCRDGYTALGASDDSSVDAALSSRQRG